MGHPHYQIGPKSHVLLNNTSLLRLSPDQRAHEGLFLAFQYPVAIPGVSVQNALKAAYEAIHCQGCTAHTHCPKLSVSQFRQELQATAKKLGISPDLLTRPLNDGFSGGEKKRVEMIALHVLKPKYVILDETDSGLDVDSIKLVARAIDQAISEGVGVLLITHYRRILDYLKPDQVSIMIKGRLVQTAGPELIDDIDKFGYSNYS
jgi:Fe-S cluster assembly ATP-binding protein